jgi:hypothetical protein
MARREGEAGSVTEEVATGYPNAGEELAGHARRPGAAAPLCCGHTDPRTRRRCSVPRAIRTSGTPGPAAGCRWIQVHPARRRGATGPWSRPGKPALDAGLLALEKAATAFHRGPGGGNAARCSTISPPGTWPHRRERISMTPASPRAMQAHLLSCRRPSLATPTPFRGSYTGRIQVGRLIHLSTGMLRAARGRVRHHDAYFPQTTGQEN